jgi:hypothetical protein
VREVCSAYYKLQKLIFSSLSSFHSFCIAEEDSPFTHLFILKSVIFPFLLCIVEMDFSLPSYLPFAEALSHNITNGNSNTLNSYSQVIYLFPLPIVCIAKGDSPFPVSFFCTGSPAFAVCGLHCAELQERINLRQLSVTAHSSSVIEPNPNQIGTSRQLPSTPSTVPQEATKSSCQFVVIRVANYSYSTLTTSVII